MKPVALGTAVLLSYFLLTAGLMALAMGLLPHSPAIQSILERNP